MAKLGKQPLEDAPVEALPEFPGEMVEADAAVQTFTDFPHVDDPVEPTIDSAEFRQYERDHRFVEIRPRVNVPRTRICGQWYNFVANKTTTVPRYVRDWLEEQHIL